ncbi:hypothetical protein EDD37DRAFT_614597 [Exophiala viscosa]|uniref:Uncharacterized protein n=1 Tax=Exophiala viscosa TaxID=2486360 RepID=A0AAN6DMD3_9EURO|nr:hypothetical protein EDD36DRAFT_449178 [Exophiala viscosa]KAI1628512.1 hypothetical protein EDD37DRAFT_614597 [Exophiala viscosa]
MDEQKLREEYGTPPPVMRGIKTSLSGQEYYYRRVEPRPEDIYLMLEPKYPDLDCKRDDIDSGPRFDFWDESNDRTTYQADIAHFLPLLTEETTKAEKVVGRQSTIPEQSLNWWKAQCRYRGLPNDGSIRDLQARIRGHPGSGMSSSMEELLEKMKRQYELKNIRAIERNWSSASGDEKAKQWPRRFLCETLLPQTGAGEDAIAVKLDDRGHGIREACLQLDLRFLTLSPLVEPLIGTDCIFVAGTTRQAVTFKAAEIDRYARRAALRANFTEEDGYDEGEEEDGEEKEQDEEEDEDEEGDEEEEEDEEKEEEEEGESKQARTRKEFYTQFNLAKSKETKSKGQWDVSGTWKVLCPHLEEQYGHRSDQGCNLVIRLTQPRPDGLVQLFGFFEFVALTGVLRFVNPKPPTLVEEEEYTDSDENEVGYDDDESEEEGSTPTQFLFSKAALPSSKNQNVSFRWRGEETGEGEIQLYSDLDLCSLTFESPHALSGILSSSLAGDCEFQGFKEGFDAPPKSNELKRQASPRHISDPGYDWSRLSEAAYNRARLRRWG